LPREIVEEERKTANQTIEQLRQDIRARDEQLHNAEARIRKLQESGTLPHISRTFFLNLSQKRYCVMISRSRSNVPKL
jgi:hypothetical protein